LDEYRERRRLWDPIRQCVSLDGEFYEGGEVLLYPPDWLNNAEKVAEFVETSGLRKRRLTRKPVYMGVDTGEGGDDTCWVIADRYGVIDVFHLQTPVTSVIANHTIGLMTQYGLKPRNVTFDRGGGGKQIAAWLRARK